MSLVSWAVTALSAFVIAWLAASGDIDAATATPTPSLSSEDTLLARVEREVTTPLRDRHADRWRFSRVHRPAPEYRTVADAAGSDRRYAAFRIVEGGMPRERTAWRVRIDRRSGAVELSAPLPADAQGNPVWKRPADVLSPASSSLLR